MDRLKIFAISAVVMFSFGVLALVVMQRVFMPMLFVDQTPVAPMSWSVLLPEEALAAYDALVENPDNADSLTETAETSTVAALDGQTLAISGFMVPLDNLRQTTRQFLIVPYQGACIHTPAPPPNQVVSVYADYDARRYHNWQPVTVTGTMSVVNDTTELAEAGYVMALDRIAPYQAAEEDSFTTAQGAHNSPLLN